MRREDLPEHFATLDPSEQARVLEASDGLCRFVYGRTTSILVAAEPGPNADLKNGSGFVLSLNGRYYLGTAWHVVEAWEERRASGEDVQFQVGSAVLEPDSGRIWSHREDDIAFIPLTTGHLQKIDAAPIEPIRGWPPPVVQRGDYVVMSGFPGYLRDERQVDEVDLHAVSTLLQVKEVGPGYIACQFEREHWISSNWAKVPEPGTDLGGMSGGPALLVQNLAYPLVGLVSEFSANFEILYIRTLSHLPDSLDLPGR